MRTVRPLPALGIALAIALATSGVLALAPPAAATSLRALTATEVDELAHRIVEGRIVSALETQVPGTSWHAVEYEVAVERVLKDDGSVAAAMASRNGILVIRYLGTLGPSATAGGVLGMPRHEIGSRWRLALNGESSLGLTSPVGFGQGVRRLPDAAPAAAGATP